MTLSSSERLLVRAFEKRQADDFRRVQDRVKKKPVWKTLSTPSGLLRAALILPMPYVSLYTVVRLSRTASSLQPMGFLVAFWMGYFLMDLVTGLIHMRFDTIPLSMNQQRTLMEFIAWGFQRHHAIQQNWLHDDLLDSGILVTGFLTSPFYLLYLLLYSAGFITSPYTAFGWTIFITSGMHVQLFHAAAHNTWKGTHPQVQAIARQMMAWGLILDTKAHHQHHTDFDCNFALINGWSNVLLNPLYRYLERNGYIDPGVQGHAQRQVYIQEKGQLVEPYYRMFPEYRAYQERMNK